MESEFHNVEPRTREEREANANKDLHEQRLKTTRASNLEVGNPVVPTPASPMYVDESHRLARTNLADEMRQQKLEEYHRKQVGI